MDADPNGGQWRTGKMWDIGVALAGRHRIARKALGAVAVVLVLCVGVCRAQAPEKSAAEPYFLKTLNITGFVQNTRGTFLDSEAIEYNSSKNSLATERNIFQMDINDDISERDAMFIRLWGVYEPSYPFESGCLNEFLAVVHCTSDFYNQYGIREVWLKHSQGPLQLLIGREIVTWGESLAFRVGNRSTRRI